MFLEEPFHISSRHWIYALFLALAVHMTFFIVYQPSRESGSEEFSQKSLIIKLKKITFPPNVKPPPIVQPKVEPLPVQKPKPRAKPIEKPQLTLEEKPSPIVKPVKLQEPKVEPLQYSSSVHTNSDNKELSLSLKRSYESQLLAWLERHKKYPNIARRRSQQGTVVLVFTINAEGKLLSHKIIQASAHPVLNSAVVKMIKTASPMPPIPETLRRNQVRFSYTIPVHFVLNK